MGRQPLSVRIATSDDVASLVDLWQDAVRRADRAEQLADLELVVKGAAASPEQRLVVVEYDGRLAGAVLLRITTLSPINLEPCVQAFHPRVFDERRRRGVGRALMEAATTFAEENGVLHVVTAVPSASREVNRFMARLGLAPVVTFRIAPTAVLRSRVSPRLSATGESGRSKVLAARRSMRRARADRLDAAED